MFSSDEESVPSRTASRSTLTLDGTPIDGIPSIAPVQATSVPAPAAPTSCARKRSARNRDALMMSAEEVEISRFTASRLGDRYSEDSVDELLDLICSALRNGTAPLRIHRPLPAKGFKVGYAAEEVDRLLKRLRAQGSIVY